MISKQGIYWVRHRLKSNGYKKWIEILKRQDMNGEKNEEQNI